MKQKKKKDTGKKVSKKRTEQLKKFLSGVAKDKTGKMKKK